MINNEEYQEIVLADNKNCKFLLQVSVLYSNIVANISELKLGPYEISP